MLTGTLESAKAFILEPLKKKKSTTLYMKDVLTVAQYRFKMRLMKKQ